MSTFGILSATGRSGAGLDHAIEAALETAMQRSLEHVVIIDPRFYTRAVLDTVPPFAWVLAAMRPWWFTRPRAARMWMMRLLREFCRATGTRYDHNLAQSMTRRWTQHPVVRRYGRYSGEHVIFMYVEMRGSTAMREAVIAAQALAMLQETP